MNKYYFDLTVLHTMAGFRRKKESLVKESISPDPERNQILKLSEKELKISTFNMLMALI